MRKLFLLSLFAFTTAVLWGETRIEIGAPGPLGRKLVSEIAEDVSPCEIADSVRGLYERNGYHAADVSAEIETLSNGDIEVDLAIEAGPRSVVADYAILGYPNDMPALGLREGGPFVESSLAADMDALVTALENSGFPHAKAILESLSIGPIAGDSLPVRVRIRVESGDTVYIRQVILPSNAKTKPYVVQRLMLIDPPELYSQVRIDKGVARLDDEDWLSLSGKPQLLLDETGIWLLRVPVNEGRSVSINGILGYAPSSDDKGKLSGHLDASFSNMWGTGRALSLLWDQVSDQQLKIGADYTEPWLFGGRGDITLSGVYFERDSTYTERSFSVEYSLPISFDFDLDFGGGYRGVTPDSIGQNVYNIPTSREYIGQIGANWDNLRPKNNLRSGVLCGLSFAGSYIERSGPDVLFENLAKSEPILKTEADAKAAKEVFRGHVVFIGLHGRSALASGPLPLSDKYYLGGWGSLRGYREEQFSAEHLGWSNLEWRALVGLDAHGYAFSDAGVIRPAGEDAEYKLSYGLGLRLNTSIGRWDVSYGIAGGESLTDGYIHVGLSTSF